MFIFRTTVPRSAMLFLLLACLLSCCKDDGPSLTKEQINMQLIAGDISKQWVLVDYQVNLKKGLPDCVKDDIWTFTRNPQEVVHKNLTTSCVGILEDFPDEESSTWSLHEDGAQIVFFQGQYIIVSISDTKMRLNFTGGNGRVAVYDFEKK